MKNINTKPNFGLVLGEIREKVQKTSKVFSIGSYLLKINKSPLSVSFKKLIRLSFDRGQGLGQRVRITKKFFDHILFMRKEHGPEYTIK
jgi:hypothetical protein